jgi:hypothetical protein
MAGSLLTFCVCCAYRLKRLVSCRLLLLLLHKCRCVRA